MSVLYQDKACLTQEEADRSLQPSGSRLRVQVLGMTQTDRILFVIFRLR